MILFSALSLGRKRLRPKLFGTSFSPPPPDRSGRKSLAGTAFFHDVLSFPLFDRLLVTGERWGGEHWKEFQVGGKTEGSVDVRPHGEACLRRVSPPLAACEWDP